MSNATDTSDTVTSNATDTADAVMTSETGLRIERSFNASPEEVFDAWTNPEVLKRWWAVHPDGSTPVAEVDLRVDGRYRLSMENPDGERNTVAGVYREVERPSRLAYTWQWELDSGEPGHVSSVTVEFVQRGDHTDVVLEHTGLPDTESRDRHAQGWSSCLDIFRTRGFDSQAA